jgi:hypothetical protein
VTDPDDLGDEYDRLLMDCDHCGDRVMEGYQIDEHDWRFWCSKECMAADGHETAGAHSTASELGDDIDEVAP